MSSFDWRTYPPAVAAAKRLHPIPLNFDFYCFEWLGRDVAKSQTMKVTGAVFEGKKRKRVPNSIRHAYITPQDIRQAEAELLATKQAEKPL